MIPYSEFQLSQAEIESIKYRNLKKRIKAYIKEFGVEPDDNVIESFFAATKEEIERRRRSIYSKLLVDELINNGIIESNQDDSWIRLASYDGICNSSAIDYVRMDWDYNSGHTRAILFTYSLNFSFDNGEAEMKGAFPIIQEGYLGDDGTIPSLLIDAITTIAESGIPQNKFGFEIRILSKDKGGQVLSIDSQHLYEEMSRAESSSEISGTWAFKLIEVDDWVPYLEDWGLLPTSGNTESAETIDNNPNPEWLELPLMDDDELIYRCHYFKRGSENVRNYSYGYSPQHRLSKWVAYPLNESYRTGNAPRDNYWGYDPLISESIQPYVLAGYGSGYVRCHLIPSADRLYSVEANSQVFYATNFVPSDYYVDSEDLATIESKVRSISNYNDMCYVVAGVIVNESSNTITDRSGNTVTVPDYIYKVMLCQQGSRWTTYCALVNCNNREIQYLSINKLESITGLNYYPNLKDIVGEESYNEIKAQPSQK